MSQPNIKPSHTSDHVILCPLQEKNQMMNKINSVLL